MSRLRLFLDSHNRASGTFPETIDETAFAAFFNQYQQACAAEGVVPVRVHVGLAPGLAFCLNFAPDADAVRRAHARVGLPFEQITEVSTVTPADLYLPQ